MGYARRQTNDGGVLVDLLKQPLPGREDGELAPLLCECMLRLGALGLALDGLGVRLALCRSVG
jgi:hypothetical protein